jgi:hypothetical protein
MKGTRHNQMQRLRQSGRTLQYIGDKFGLSRERVRQILVERYGSTKATQMLSRSKVAKKLNCAKSRLIKLEKMGKVYPVKNKGKVMYFIPNLPEISKLVKSLEAPRVTHICQYCGKSFTVRQSSVRPQSPYKYCSRECWYNSIKR